LLNRKANTAPLGTHAFQERALIADIVGGFFGVGSFGGFIGNFLIAYLPYKFVRDHGSSSTSSIGEFLRVGCARSSVARAMDRKRTKALRSASRIASSWA
jgi:hypothetical protein